MGVAGFEGKAEATAAAADGPHGAFSLTPPRVWRDDGGTHLIRNDHHG
jgi:hypothetical protein